MCVRELATAKQSQDKPALSRVPETSRRIWLNQDATSAAQSQDKQLCLQAPRSQRFGCLHVRRAHNKQIRVATPTSDTLFIGACATAASASTYRNVASCSSASMCVRQTRM